MDSAVLLHLLILVAGILAGLWWAWRSRRERWQRLTTELHRGLPEALRAALPQVTPEALPIAEEIAAWRQEIDDALRTAVELERQVSAREAELSLRTSERDRAVANLAERARELAEVERRLTVADATHAAECDQLEQLKRTTRDKQLAWSDLARRVDAADLAAKEEERLLARSASNLADLTGQRQGLLHRVEEEVRRKSEREVEVERVRREVGRLRSRVEPLRQRHAAAEADAVQRTSQLQQATARREALHLRLGELVRSHGEAARKETAARDTAEGLQAQHDPPHIAYQREVQDLSELRHCFDRDAPARDQLLRDDGQLQAELSQLLAEQEGLEVTTRDAELALFAAREELRQQLDEQTEIDRQLGREAARVSALQVSRERQDRDLKRTDDRLATLELQQKSLGVHRVHNQSGAQEAFESLVAAVARKRELVRRVETRELDLNSEIDRLRRLCLANGEEAARERAYVDPLRLQLAQAQQTVADRGHELEVLRQRESATRVSERNWNQKISTSESALTERQLALRAATARIQDLRRQLELTEAELIDKRGEVAIREGRLAARHQAPTPEETGSTLEEQS